MHQSSAKHRNGKDIPEIFLFGLHVASSDQSHKGGGQNESDADKNYLILFYDSGFGGAGLQPIQHGSH
jgi:hypothetical protein